MEIVHKRARDKLWHASQTELIFHFVAIVIAI